MHVGDTGWAGCLVGCLSRVHGWVSRLASWLVVRVRAENHGLDKLPEHIGG